MKDQRLNEWLSEEMVYSKEEVRGMLSLVCELIGCYTTNGRNPTMPELIKDMENSTGINGIRPWEKMHVNLPFFKEKKSFDETIRKIKENMDPVELKKWDTIPSNVYLRGLIDKKQS